MNNFSKQIVENLLNYQEEILNKIDNLNLKYKIVNLKINLKYD